MATHAAFVGTFDRDDVGEWTRPAGELVVYEAAPLPKWTNDPPSHEGWWHVRFPGEDQYTIAAVFRNAAGVLAFATCRHGEQVPVRKLKLEWSSRCVRAPE